MVAEKSRAFSPHGEAKKQALGPDDLRASALGRPVLSPYPMSPRDMAKITHDQHLLHFTCEFTAPSWPIYGLICNVYCLMGTSNQTCPCPSPAFQQGGHPSLPGLPQDSGRLAAVRPLTMTEPPPLIPSTKPGGSITQVYTFKKNIVQSHSWPTETMEAVYVCMYLCHKIICFHHCFNKFLFLQGTPVQLHSPAHGLDHGKLPPTQMGLWMDQRKLGE